jgi:hypothetical protein
MLSSDRAEKGGRRHDARDESNNKQLAAVKREVDVQSGWA